MSLDGCSVLVRLVPVVTERELREPESARRQMYQEGAFVQLSRENTPVVVDHDKDHVVGQVLEFYTADDAQGGRWTWAHCEIASAPGWLRRGTPCSFAWSTLSRQDMGTWSRVLKAAVHEVSLLSPGVEPAEPRARVWWISPREAKGRVADRRKVIEHRDAPGQSLIRPNSGYVIGVR